MTQQYLYKCPHLKTVTRERGDWVTDERGRSSYRLDKTREEIVPCGERSYMVISDQVFTLDSGFDPEGIKVRCKGCGQEYYIFPGKGEKLSRQRCGGG